jgi:hypothetical protein
MSSVQIRSLAPAFHSGLTLYAPRAGFDRWQAKVPKVFGAMKFAIVAGRAIGLAVAEGWAVEMPNAARAIEVGGPTPLTRAPAPATTARPLVSPVYQSVPAPRAYTPQYPVTEFNPHRPHWVGVSGC